MRKESTFTIYFFLLTALFVILGAGLNYYVDPAGAFAKGVALERTSKEYVQEMRDASIGVKLQGQTRSVKYHLLQHASEVECLILGSSHVMQVSAITQDSPLKSICSSSLYLGVGGGNLEDLLLFLTLIKERSYRGRLLVGIDPWTMKIALGSSHNTYPLTSIEQAQLQTSYPELFVFSKASFDFKALLSFDYLRSSFKYLAQHKLSAFTLPETKMDVTADWKPIEGYQDGALLKDGSHVYSVFHTKVHHTDENYQGLGSYGLSGEVWQEKAWELFKKIVDEIKDKNELSILLMPYHPNVFRKSNTKYQFYILEMEKRVRSEMKRKGIKVLGSYDARKLGCKATEFYDAEHANYYCLNKINYLKEVE